MKNYLFILEYDGTRYNGWQKLGNTDNTIQGKLERVLSRMDGAPVQVIGAGRTDAGVHARGQAANAHLKTALSADGIRAYVNHYLPEDIRVLRVEEAAPRFHCRFHAAEKRYCYYVSTGEKAAVFERKFIYQLGAEPALLRAKEQPGTALPQAKAQAEAARAETGAEPVPKILPGSAPRGTSALNCPEINLPEMRRAAALLCGTHDFTSFCGNRHFKKSAVRTVYEITIAYDAEREMLTFSYRGDGFLQYMIRILTGTLLEVGLGKRKAETMTDLLAARDRAQVGYTVPPCGLFLEEVHFAELKK